MSAPSILETAETCYSMAYCVLPDFLFERPEAVVSRFEENSRKAVLYYYFAACQRMEHEPSREAAAQLAVHCETLGEGVEAIVISYPPPPPLTASAAATVLAPYFSAIVKREDRIASELYVLGQAPLGGTTLRTITPTANANLGPGCDPNLDAFVALLRSRPRGGPPLC